MIHARFARIHKEGNKVNLLFLEEFQWDDEWVDKDNEVVQQMYASKDDLTWGQVDVVVTNSSPHFFLAVILGEVAEFKVVGNEYTPDGGSLCLVVVRHA
jgi:hypothetical protein